MSNASERAENFIKRVESLSVSERVALKRSLGRSFSAASSGAKLGFYHAYAYTMPGHEGAEERELPFFICACGWCFMERMDGPGENFIGNMRRLAIDSPDGILGKLASLLDTPISQQEVFAQKISHLLRHMKSQGMKVDYVQLLTDLQGWHWNDNGVQKKWMRAYYMVNREENNDAD